jgi:hypothetical protein
MCTEIWVPDERREISNQYDLAKWLRVPVKRLPTSHGHTEQSLRGAVCLCPVDVERALTDAGASFEREADGGYTVRRG